MWSVCWNFAVPSFSPWLYIANWPNVGDVMSCWDSSSSATLALDSTKCFSFAVTLHRQSTMRENTTKEHILISTTIVSPDQNRDKTWCALSTQRGCHQTRPKHYELVIQLCGSFIYMYIQSQVSWCTLDSALIDSTFHQDNSVTTVQCLKCATAHRFMPWTGFTTATVARAHG